MTMSEQLARRRLMRRIAAGTGLLLTGLVQMAPSHGQQVEASSALKPGQFTWHPDRSPVGPLAIVVSLPDQLVHVYRNGIRIAVSTCSTGRPGHLTPTGVFTVLQKDEHHRSTIYSGAPMSDMMRLTWSGIALHVGDLPGYPSSHGCVHLPAEFSRRLFAISHLGMAVIIADNVSAPTAIVHPGLVLTQGAEGEIDQAVHKLGTRPLPGSGTTLPLSILISRADARFIILEDGNTVATGPISIADPARPLGAHVMILSGGAPTAGLTWHAFSHGDSADDGRSAIDAFDRIHLDPAGRKAISDRLHPGTILTLTDLPLSPDSRSGRDFVVISTTDA